MSNPVKGPVSVFAKSIMEQKYSHKVGDKLESWEEISTRVVENVMSVVSVSPEMVEKLKQAVIDRKFIPGGRYLAATGNAFHNTQNCLLLRADDSREGWSELMYKATMALMTGSGIGVVYSDVRPEGSPVKRTGGVSTGPLALMQMLNEAGRGIMQGGNRRSAIWAGLHWNHKDVMKFINMKNWSPEVKAMKEKDYNFPATMDGTNISVILDDDFFTAFNDPSHAQNILAHEVYHAVVTNMLKTAEPGFSVDVGINNGENNRNACVTGDTEILTKDGYRQIKELVGEKIKVWNGFEWSEVVPKITGENKEVFDVTLSSGQSITCTDNHTWWISTNYNGGKKEVKTKDLEIGMKLIKTEMPVIEGGNDVEYAYTQGFISGDGMDDYPFMHVYETKYMCIPRLSGKASKINNEQNKAYFKFNFDHHPKSFIPFNWSLNSKLDWLAGLLDADGTELVEGGAQIGSVNKQFLINVQKLLTTLGATSKVTFSRAAGIRKMPDGKGGEKDFFCQESYRLLINAVQIQDLKKLGLHCERLSFNKNPQRDASQFVTITGIESNGIVDQVYCFNEPKRHLGCFNGVVTGQCTEITSRDDSDICNLGSINLARVESLEEMKELVELGTVFLLAGTVYSHLPYEKVNTVREKNRRLGLGLMGLHEWLLSRGKKYGPDVELEQYLKIYATSTEIAGKYAEKWNLSKPIKTRAIAPVGTIGIVGETTTGIEPIFCVAYKRRYIKDGLVHYQYVVDPTAQKLINSGIKEELVEDAYSLAEDVERRVAFQAWVQQFVDHGISSTINLPAWGSFHNNEDKVPGFENMLMKYLPKLRGVTTYPDGARSGQPLQPVKYSEAISNIGQVFVEQADVCDITKRGTCGA